MGPRRPVSLCASPLAFAALLCAIATSPALAETVKPRFVILIDTSGSMAENTSPFRNKTHGDGSELHPGCDHDDNGLYDDSKLYQAKAALNDTIAAFGSAEFSLARYHQDELAQSCTTTSECIAMGKGANACIGGRCANNISSLSPDYNECAGGSLTASGNGCVRCADPDNDPSHVWYNGATCCPADAPRPGGFGIAGDVLVGFPSAGVSNYADLTMWMDGKEDFPAGSNRELRAAGTTPIGGALNAVRSWLVTDGSEIGPASGTLNRDAQIGCRAYNVILITDGLEIAGCSTNCGLNAARAAELLYHSCTNGGIWDAFDGRCELAGSPAGTSEVRVKTYVVGFTVNDPSLNAIAAAGGTGTALLANNQAELTARLGDIVAGSIPTERCNCQDDTCDAQIDETFPTKGDVCTVGIGRCKRQGQLGCGADGTAVTCASSASGVCPAMELAAGAPITEQCGAAAGCDAPTAADCADDDCDGLVDENISCACTAKPEVCNGVDDDCNGTVDDVAAVACGLAIGECRPGTTACVDDGAGGKRTVCLGATGPTPELCDARDNDCDGVVDGFGLACYPAAAAGCAMKAEAPSCGGAPVAGWECAGVCQTGLLTCADGMCGACNGAVTPMTEVACDLLDNDCDGQTDEGFNLGGACGAGLGGVGECRPGVLRCEGTSLRCVGGQAPIEEICNGKDDDCNGAADDLTATCGLAKGECRPGRLRCRGAEPYCDQPQGPAAEVCNGKDDDCDGAIDDEPTDPELLRATMCGSGVGSCRPGVLKCVGGGKYCEGGVNPERERCNGLDDDCDGTADDGINPPGPCGVPGLPAGTPAVGECRPAMNVCTAGVAGTADFRCVGGTGPAAETCDGKDNDCDGAIDDAATCPTGQGCADGACVPRCEGSDLTCPADRVCKDSLCVHAECVKRPCPTGSYCDPRRGCVDRCEGVTCAAGTVCEGGLCTSCHLRGCPQGQVCRVARCEPDPCAGKSCAADSYCSEGQCEKSCAAVRCKSGQICRRGTCEVNRCGGKTCGAGELCDPRDGVCRRNGCELIQCLRGQACVVATETCVPDPCLVTTCRGDDVCVLTFDGKPECLSRATLKARQTTNVSLGGSGCSVASGGSPSLPPLFLVPALAGVLRLARRRGGSR